MSAENSETFEDHFDRFVPGGRVENPAEAQDQALLVEAERKRIEKDGPVEKDPLFDSERDIMEEVLPDKILSRETNYQLLDNQISDRERRVEELKREIAALEAVKAGRADMTQEIRDSLRSGSRGSLLTEEGKDTRGKILEKERLQKRVVKPEEGSE